MAAEPPASPPPGSSPLDRLPRPLIEPHAHRSIWLFWLIPIVAILAGGWLGARTLLERGPQLTVRFRSGDGVEAGKTRIKYKDVNIGLVKAVDLSEDHSQVVISAELNKGLESVLVEDTKFWVVRPRVAATGVSGLGTLFSGAYVALDIGKSATRQRDFIGLETPPLVTTDLPGRQFVLRASDLGSLEIGSPVYFRRVPVGQVVAYGMEADGSSVTVRVFINEPYDRFVTRDTRFWQASGLDVSLDTSGLKVDMQSLTSIVIGAVAFETPALPDGEPAPESPPNSRFRLASDRSDAYRRPETGGSDYVMLFKGSVRGLNIGAPVDFRGIVVGEVTDIRTNFVSPDKDIDMAVTMRVYPERLRATYRVPVHDSSPDRERRVVDAMVKRGFRAQLRTGNLLTGQLYIALDFFSQAARAGVAWNDKPPEFPTVPGTLETLQQSLLNVVAKLDRFPIEALGEQSQRTLKDVDQAVNRADTTLDQLGTTLQHADALIGQLDKGVAPELRAMVQEARRAVDAANRAFSSIGGTLGAQSPLQSDARAALTEVSNAARSLRVLADYLERHPESLLRGKPKDGE
jgi:paraquat-inducible protein B